MQIKTEYLSQRCVICHQADMFNPQTDDCGRCDSLIIANTALAPAGSVKSRVALRFSAEDRVFLSGYRTLQHLAIVFRILKLIRTIDNAIYQSTWGLPFLAFMVTKLIFVVLYSCADMQMAAARAYLQIAVVGFIMGLATLLEGLNQVEACTALFKSAREVSLAKK